MRRPVRWSADALADFADQVTCIATEAPAAAHRVAEMIDRKALALGERPTGRPGRVTGTYETSVRGLPYILAYAITPAEGGEDVIAIVRVIHTSRDWPAETWPE